MGLHVWGESEKERVGTLFRRNRLFLFGRDDRDHRAPFHAGRRFDHAFFADGLDHLFDQRDASIFVRDLASTKLDGDLCFVTFFEEA